MLCNYIHYLYRNSFAYINIFELSRKIKIKLNKIKSDQDLDFIKQVRLVYIPIYMYIRAFIHWYHTSIYGPLWLHKVDWIRCKHFVGFLHWVHYLMNKAQNKACNRFYSIQHRYSFLVSYMKQLQIFFYRWIVYIFWSRRFVNRFTIWTNTHVHVYTPLVWNHKSCIPLYIFRCTWMNLENVLILCTVFGCTYMKPHE